MHEIYTKICSVLFVCRTQSKKKRFFRMRKMRTKQNIYSRETTKKENDYSIVLLHFPK